MPLGRIYKNTSVEPGSVHYYECEQTTERKKKIQELGKRCSEALSKWNTDQRCSWWPVRGGCIFPHRRLDSIK